MSVRLVMAAAALGLCAAAMAACGGDADPDALRELQRVRAGDLDVVLLSPNEAVREGKDVFFVEFRQAADGQPVEVGEVTASATMPMAGMAPMVGAIDVRRTDVRGRHVVSSNLSMAGDWRIGLEWNGPAGRGAVTLNVSAL